MALAEANPAAFETFMESYTPSFGDRVGDLITKTGRSMYQPLQFGEGAPSISDQLFNMDRAKQAAFMLGPMTTYAGMDALDQMENAGTGGSEGTASGPSAQSLYDDFLQSGRLAGYTDEEINTLYAPYGDMASGTYDMVNVDRGPRRRQFPGTNYNLFTYANGGRVNKAFGGAIGMALREAIEAAMKNPNLYKVFNPKDKIGQVMEMLKKTPKTAIRDKRTNNIGLFGKRKDRDIDMYQDDIIKQMEEMDSFANGGRAGYADGGIDLSGSAVDPLSDNEPDMETLQGIRDYIEYMNEMEKAKAMQLEKVPNPVGRANGGIMQAPGVPQGMELDYRNTGGFIPMGGPEKADDVPAMLSKNEFVMTADAVRAAGGGSVNKGAKRMYDLMDRLEARV